LKIIILQGAFFPVPPIQGGAVEKIWFRMGQEFSDLGHEVLHISRSHLSLPNYEKSHGVQYVRVPGFDTPSSLLKLKLLDLIYTRRAIKEIPADADIIITNTFWAPFLLRGNQGRKVYVSVERVPKGQMRFYRHVGRIRGCSPAICEAIRAELATTSHPLVSYVPNPVPFDVKPTAVTREKVVLFVGRLHPEKGIHVLLEAFTQIEANVSQEWRLVIVGPSEVKAGGGGEAYYKSLVDLAKNLKVEFIGPVYKENELINYYAKASIFCYPAQDGSGDAAPVAPREAMSYGCVPIVSKLACFTDFITSGENGLTYNQKASDQANELAQAISLLILNNMMLKRMAEEGKKVIQTYSPQVVAKEFIKDFENIYFASK
jgi:glycosyltransferase involved in cell wall biosynthesis